MRPIFPVLSVIHRYPPEEATPSGWGTGNSVTVFGAAVRIRPIRFVLLKSFSVNQTLPSGPTVMSCGCRPVIGK